MPSVMAFEFKGKYSLFMNGILILEAENREEFRGYFKF